MVSWTNRKFERNVLGRTSGPFGIYDMFVFLDVETNFADVSWVVSGHVCSDDLREELVLDVFVRTGSSI